MAIKYTSRIPQQTTDTGPSFNQAPAFPRLMDRRDWNDPYGLNRYQYVTPADFQRWASQQKQEGGDSQGTANVQRGQAATALANSYNIAAGKQPAAQPEAPKSELDQERERLRNKFQAPLHDDSNAWVQSANRGRAAIDNGQQLKPTPEVGSYEFATRTLPSGSENNYIRYDTVGEDLNDVGKDWLRSKNWTDDQINNFNDNKYNYGFMQALEKVGGLDHTQENYEAYEREKRRKQMEYEMAMRQNYGPTGSQAAMALGVPDDSGSTGGTSVADYYQLDNDSTRGSVADYYQLDSQGYNDAPGNYSTYDPLDGGQGLRYRGPDNRPDWAKQPLFAPASPEYVANRLKNWD